MKIRDRKHSSQEFAKIQRWSGLVENFPFVLNENLRQTVGVWEKS